MREIKTRASFFILRWRAFATQRNINPSLILDTFSQIRAGLPTWYAIGASKLQMQWVAFGIPLPAYPSLTSIPALQPFRYNRKGQPDSDSDFIITKIKEMAAKGSVMWTPLINCGILTPLFERTSSNKKRLIADFRYINRYLYKLKYNMLGADHFASFGDIDDLYISTDFSSFWEQLRLQIPFQKTCAGAITIKQQTCAFWPTHGMFGLSCIPFFANFLMKPVISVLNIVGVASIWVDDLFCKVGNMRDPNAHSNCQASAHFIANLLSGLCLRQSAKKADFTPSTIKSWVGKNVSAEGNFIKLDKLFSILEICNLILSKGRCTYQILNSLLSKMRFYGRKKSNFLSQELA